MKNDCFECNKMSTKTLWFHISSDYRSGSSIEVYTKPYSEESDSDEEEETAPEEASEITFEVPKKGYRIYVVNEYPNYKPIWHKDLKESKECKTLYLKLFSQIHDCMPFEVTGYTAGYQQEGEYPEVPEDIQSMESIDIGHDITEDSDAILFVCVIDHEGDEIFTKLLTPIC